MSDFSNDAEQGRPDKKVVPFAYFQKKNRRARIGLGAAGTEVSIPFNPDKLIRQCLIRNLDMLTYVVANNKTVDEELIETAKTVAKDISRNTAFVQIAGVYQPIHELFLANEKKTKYNEMLEVIFPEYFRQADPGILRDAILGFMDFAEENHLKHYDKDVCTHYQFTRVALQHHSGLHEALCSHLEAHKRETTGVASAINGYRGILGLPKLAETPAHVSQACTPVHPHQRVPTDFGPA